MQASAQCEDGLQLLVVEPFTDEEMQLNPRPVRRRFSAGRGLALVAAVLGVAAAATFFGPKASGLTSFGPDHSGALTDLVQAYALERSGRTLTSSELSTVFGNARINNRSCDFEALEKLASSGQDETQEQAINMGLSANCSRAISLKLQDVAKQFTKLLVDSLFSCVLIDSEGDECMHVTDKMADYFNVITDECKESGEFCDIVASELVDGVVDDESQSVCVPPACFAEAEHAIDFIKEMLDDALAAAPTDEVRNDISGELSLSDSDCLNCTLSIKCGA